MGGQLHAPAVLKLEKRPRILCGTQKHSGRFRGREIILLRREFEMYFLGSHTTFLRLYKH
jgi:hypothetical protein